VTHDPLRICLERTIALASVELRFRDWPGFGRPIVHFAHTPVLALDLAQQFAPRYRVLSLLPRDGVSYQADAMDLRSFLRAFGFEAPVVVGDGHGAVAALLVAAWWPSEVGALALVSPERHEADAGLAGRGLRECPPDWDALLAMVRCPVFTLEELRERLRTGAAG
jgi:pimeloyl-ACP methyl ester carboxylesterase